MLLKKKQFFLMGNFIPVQDFHQTYFRPSKNRTVRAGKAEPSALFTGQTVQCPGDLFPENPVRRIQICGPVARKDGMLPRAQEITDVRTGLRVGRRHGFRVERLLAVEPECGTRLHQ